MKQLIVWRRAYDKIEPSNIDDYFEKGEEYQGSLATLLLENESTAIFHVDNDRTFKMGDQDYMEAFLLGVNYHDGHSEGDYKIVVQDVAEEKGPWVLFRPPGSDERTFYLQHPVFPGLYNPKFEKNVANPLKIKHFYLFRGNPKKTFEDFEVAGYNFVNDAMPEEEYRRLRAP